MCLLMLQAMKEEIDSLKKNKIWDLLDTPKDQRQVGCKWIFKKKIGIQGIERTRYKTRLVVKGLRKRKDVNFNESFSPVVNQTSIKMVLSVVIQNNMELDQMDVKTALLRGELQEKTYTTWWFLARKCEQGLSIEEVSIWIEAIIETIACEVWKVYGKCWVWKIQTWHICDLKNTNSYSQFACYSMWILCSWQVKIYWRWMNSNQDWKKSLKWKIWDVQGKFWT